VVRRRGNGAPGVTRTLIGRLEGGYRSSRPGHSERKRVLETQPATLATSRPTLGHPRIGWCGWICTSYLRLIGPTRICMCFTPSIGRNGRTRTYIGVLPRHVVNL
jgi:hypothetical protein